MANDTTMKTTAITSPTALPKPPTFEYADTDLVTVLYRYGQVPSNYKQLLGNLRFVGGVCRDVPGHVARQLQMGTRTVVTDDGREIIRRAYFKANNLYVLPNDATPVDYARFAQIKTEPTQVAAMLAASDIAEVVRLLGEDATAELIAKLELQQKTRKK